MRRPGEEIRLENLVTLNGHNLPTCPRWGLFRRLVFWWMIRPCEIGWSGCSGRLSLLRVAYVLQIVIWTTSVCKHQPFFLGKSDWQNKLSLPIIFQEPISGRVVLVASLWKLYLFFPLPAGQCDKERCWVLRVSYFQAWHGSLTTLTVSPGNFWKTYENIPCLQSYPRKKPVIAVNLYQT